MSSAQSGSKFVISAKRAESDFMEGMLSDVKDRQDYRIPTLEEYIDKADLSRQAGDSADARDVAHNEYSHVEPTAKLMNGVYEAARIRRDLNIGLMSRMERFASAYALLANQCGNLRYDIEKAEGKRE